MTEIYFNDLTARVGVATVAVEVGIDDLAVGFLDTLAIRINDWRTR